MTLSILRAGGRSLGRPRHKRGGREKKTVSSLAARKKLKVVACCDRGNSDRGGEGGRGKGKEKSFKFIATNEAEDSRHILAPRGGGRRKEEKEEGFPLLQETHNSY